MNFAQDKPHSLRLQRSLHSKEYLFQSRLQKFVGQKIQRGEGNFLLFQLKPPNCFASGQRILDFIDVGIYRLQIREQLVSKSRLPRKRLVFTSCSRSNFSRAATELCPPGKSKVGTSFKEPLSFYRESDSNLNTDFVFLLCRFIFLLCCQVVF